MLLDTAVGGAELFSREKNLLLNETEELRLQARESQKALLQHIAEHGC
jgi:hypothetical protein